VFFRRCKERRSHHLGGPVAAGGVLAVTVTDVQSAAHGGGDGPAGPPEVEDFRVGSEDDAADGAVTGVAADLFGAQHVAVQSFVGAAPNDLGGRPNR
jgi:hypothetical protein